MQQISLGIPVSLSDRTWLYIAYLAFFLFLLSGLKTGFVNKLLPLLTLFLSVWISRIAAPYLTMLVMNNSSIQSVLANILPTDGYGNILDVTLPGPLNALNGLGASSFGQTVNIQNVTISLFTLSMSLALLRFLAGQVFHLGEFLNHIPLVGLANRLLGVVVGFAEGVLFFVVIFTFLKLLMAWNVPYVGFIYQQLLCSNFLKWIHDINIMNLW